MTTSVEDPIRVLAAGSLRNAFADIIGAFTTASGLAVSADFGPAGLLRQRIETGEAFDLFASANMDHPLRLAEQGLATDARRFARNRLCVLARRDLGLTLENFLSIGGDPLIRIGMSTPGADPSGDYAVEVFRRIEALHPGVGMAFLAKARPLVGGPTSPPIPAGKAAGAWMIAEGEADLFLTYQSNARLSIDDPDLAVMALPDDLSPIADYGVALNPQTGSGPSTLRDFLLSQTGQAHLAAHGFVTE
jgi:molybdate transport system substrate-binding protein